MNNQDRYNQAVMFWAIYYDYRKANKIIEWVLCKKPEYVKFLKLKCDVLIDSGKHEKAKQYAEKLLKLKPRSPDVLCTSAEICRDAGDFGNALKYISRAKKYWEYSKNSIEFEQLLSEEILIAIKSKAYSNALQLASKALAYTSKKEYKIEFKSLLACAQSKNSRDINARKSKSNLKDKDYRARRKYLYWDKENGIYRISKGAVALNITGTKYIRMSNKRVISLYSKLFKVALGEISKWSHKKLDKMITDQYKKICATHKNWNLPPIY